MSRTGTAEVREPLDDLRSDVGVLERLRRESERPRSSPEDRALARATFARLWRNLVSKCDGTAEARAEAMRPMGGDWRKRRAAGGGS